MINIKQLMMLVGIATVAVPGMVADDWMKKWKSDDAIDGLRLIRCGKEDIEITIEKKEKDIREHRRELLKLDILQEKALQAQDKERAAEYERAKQELQQKIDIEQECLKFSELTSLYYSDFLSPTDWQEIREGLRNEQEKLKTVYANEAQRSKSDTEDEVKSAQRRSWFEITRTQQRAAVRSRPYNEVAHKLAKALDECLEKNKSLKDMHPTALCQARLEAMHTVLNELNADEQSQEQSK